jgi:Fungal chitosanase of glycosyl hydrolase group 75
MRHVAGIIAALTIARCWAATVEGNIDPLKLLAWVDTQKTVAANLVVRANGKDMNNGGTGFCAQCSNDQSQPTAQKKTISLFQTDAAVFFEADMDIDCDGSNNGICGGTDPSHQNQLSCDANVKCSMDNGGPIDAAGTPFYVIPVGSPFNYSSRGIGIGQLAAVINRKTNPVSIVYAPFLDEDGVSQEIGEASAYMASLLGVPNNPNTGGQDTGLAYIIFRGAAARFTSVADMANHQKAITTGQALAAALLSPVTTAKSAPENGKPSPVLCRVTESSLRITAADAHSVSVCTLTGETVWRKNGIGAAEYDISHLKRGCYSVTIRSAAGSFTERFVRD